MFALARLLIRERLREVSLHYGWACYASLCLMIVLFAGTGAGAVAGYVRQSTAARLGSLLAVIWAAWVVTAVLLGKDLSWRIRLERIVIFPVPGFARLYGFAFLLGFLSIPLLLCLSVAGFWAFLRSGPDPALLVAALAGGGLYIASVRWAASLLRPAMRPEPGTANLQKWSAALAGLSPLAYAFASIAYPRIGGLFPGIRLGLLLSGESVCGSLFAMSAFAGLLGAADLALQRRVTYSGARHSPIGGAPAIAAGRLLLSLPSRPGPVYRISFLGWVRSRNVLLLLAWGVLYGFFFMHFAHADGALDFFLFIWMNQIFHAYLRGNLLGIDRGGIWIYYMFPNPIEDVLSSKSLSLSLLQGIMIAAVIAGGVSGAGRSFAAVETARIVSYALSSLLAGDICGICLSIRYPVPIDGLSWHSGGTAAGAMAVPILLAMFGLAFLISTTLAGQFLPPAACWAALAAAPALLAVVRFAVLHSWAHAAMIDGREAIMKKLSAYSI